MESGNRLKSISKELIELIRAAHPLQAYNRQILKMLVDIAGARAATLWIVREKQLLMADQVEKNSGAASSLQTGEDRQQAAIKRCYERHESVTLSSGASAASAETLVFVPVSDFQGVFGVARLVLGKIDSDALRRTTQLSEVICGYYSLYSANRMLSARQEERQEIDRLSKAILQLQHYTFSNHLPEVVVNSAVEVVPIDRAVLMTRKSEDAELDLTAVSSAIESSKESAWTRLSAELGRLVIEGGEPIIFSRKQKPEEIENQALREKVNSYLLMTGAAALMAFPLLSGKEGIGVLIMERFEEQRRTAPFEETLCTIYAAHSASAVGNHRIFSSIPLHNFYSKKLELEEEEVGRRPLQIGKAVKAAVLLALLAGVVYLGAFHPAVEKISSDCFVTPMEKRILASKVAGEIEHIYFQQGQLVRKGDPLIQLRTEDIRLQLGREREHAKSISAEIAKFRGRAEDERDPDQRGRILAEIRALQHSYNAKLKEIEMLEDRLEACLISASIDGIMMEPEEPEMLLGVTVMEGERLAGIGSMHETVKVQIAVPPDRILEVKENMQVRIALQPLIGQEDIVAEITRIADRSVNYRNKNVFMATAIVPNTGDDPGGAVLKAGMTGKARIVLPGTTSYFSIYGRRLLRRLQYWLF